LHQTGDFVIFNTANTKLMEAGFNKPYLSGNELAFIQDAVHRQKLSGNGYYTNLCHQFLVDKYQFRKVLLTTSGTAAIEMASLLLNIQPGDEVIIPSYTFVSSANPFVLRGANIKFVDCLPDHPNVDPAAIEKAITSKTKAIVVVHYAGIACDMDAIMHLAQKHNIYVVEDAAQAINGFYKGKPLGSIGHIGCFSFHETKNINCGEGGLLVVNDEQFFPRAEIIWEKGTNRAAFSRGEIKKYDWVDVGSSFLPSEISAAFLYGQLENIQRIQERRTAQWEYYFQSLTSLDIQLPIVPGYSSNNAHIFYLLCKNQEQRDLLAVHFAKNRINAISHYIPLHLSPYFISKHPAYPLPYATKFADTILRLPLFYELSSPQQDYIIEHTHSFFARVKHLDHFAYPAQKIS
jgi:dTDP-4-amino-4,6-dideoxygalactose transaminase